MSWSDEDRRRELPTVAECLTAALSLLLFVAVLWLAGGAG